LKETLNLAKKRNPFTPKIGPGRKTNTEHAIGFYEYLYDRLTSGKDVQETTSVEPESEDEEEEEEDDEESNLSSMGTQEFNAQHNDLCEVCDGEGELLLCSTCNLAFHLSCVRPVMRELPNDKHWKCSYCILSTEPKNSKPRRQAAAAVRMMARLRNQSRRKKLNVESEEEGAASKVEGKDEEAQKTPDRKISKVLVETSSKNKEEEVDTSSKNKEESVDTSSKNKEEVVDTPSKNKEDDHGDKTEADKYRDKKPASSEELITPSKDEKEDDKQSKEGEKSSHTDSPSKKRALTELLTTSASADASEEAGRGKRARKQPIMYDPQFGPARKWQSDKLIEWNISRSEHSEKGPEKGSDSVSGDENMVEDRKMDSPRRRTDGIWCGFCGDDSTMKVCCFCACRVCFGKHHQTKLLLCDRCDNEYHTFCLDPPLKSVPKRKWYCPNCVQTEDKRVARGSSRVEPKGKKESTPSPRRSSTRKVALASKDSQEDKQTDKQKSRRRSSGKNKTPSSENRKLAESRIPGSADQPRTKTGRFSAFLPFGKKSHKSTPKTTTKTTPKTASSGKASSSSKKRRRDGSAGRPSRPVGRPPSKKKEETARARTVEKPPSVTEEPPKKKAALESTEEAIPKPVPATVSRSGRTVKRSSFHDEIGHGEQHLRVSRLLQETKASATAVPTKVQEPSTEEALEPKKIQSDVPVTTKKIEPKASDIDAPKKTATEAATKLQEKKVDSNIVETPAIEKVPPMSVVVQPAAAMGSVSSPPTSVGTTSNLKPAPAVVHTPVASIPPTAPVASAPADASIEFNPAVASAPVGSSVMSEQESRETKVPRRKPGARECMQISRRFGVEAIPQRYMEILTDYCKRGKVEHLIRMRERLDDHARYLESQLAGLEALVQQKNQVQAAQPSPASGLNKKD
jgi:hypothetical protein